MSGQVCSQHLIRTDLPDTVSGCVLLRMHLDGVPFTTTTTALRRCTALGRFRQR